MKIEIEVIEIPGFAYTGEYRPPKVGEWYKSTVPRVCIVLQAKADHPFPLGKKLILRKVDQA